VPYPKLNLPTKRASRDVGKQIRAIRERKGIAQATLSMQIGMTRQNYARIEAGLTNVTLDSMVRIASALGCEVRVSFAPIRSRRHSKVAPHK
jgi:transcriptional regulator with XRE-family HTH domain